jgi:hypothetical protein
VILDGAGFGLIRFIGWTVVSHEARHGSVGKVEFSDLSLFQKPQVTRRQKEIDKQEGGIKLTATLNAPPNGYDKHEEITLPGVSDATPLAGLTK